MVWLCAGPMAAAQEGHGDYFAVCASNNDTRCRLDRRWRLEIPLGVRRGQAQNLVQCFEQFFGRVEVVGHGQTCGGTHAEPHAA